MTRAAPSKPGVMYFGLTEKELRHISKIQRVDFDLPTRIANSSSREPLVLPKMGGNREGEDQHLQYTGVGYRAQIDRRVV